MGAYHMGLLWKSKSFQMKGEEFYKKMLEKVKTVDTIRYKAIYDMVEARFYKLVKNQTLLDTDFGQYMDGKVHEELVAMYKNDRAHLESSMTTSFANHP